MATSTIKTDENNDFFIDSLGNFVIISGIDAVLQDTRAETLLRTGEDIYNANKGVDYLGSIFAPQANYDDARKSLVTAIESSPDVVRVDSLTITIEGENFEYSAEIMSIYGPLTVTNS
jgi:hypothetical protein